MEIRLSESIRRLRKESGFTQEQLAEALGVSVSAVHKWESGKATPELEMLVDIAEFFETSVDAMLNYGWQKLSMGQAVDKLRHFPVDKNLQEGMRFAEKALQKHPNSFEVVYYSAKVYFLSMDPKYMPRAAELYEKAIVLIDQNTNNEINAMTIQNSIAYCYCYMDRTHDAIEMLKRNNVEGMNNFRIGLLMSQDPTKAEESLMYLSEALSSCYSNLYNICIGYANAYGALEKLDEIADLTLWLHELGKGLRDTTVINWMDRGDVKLYLILAEVDYLRGNEQGAYDWLVKAKQTAERFDAAPNYRTSTGLKYYHGSYTAMSYDDMGATAMDMIKRYMSDEVEGKNLRALWAKICEEQKTQPGGGLIDIPT